MPNTNEQLSREQQIAALEKDWASNPRWKGVKRGYSAADVVRLRGSVQVEHTLAKRGAEIIDVRGKSSAASAASAATTSVSSVRYPVASPVAAATRSTMPGYSSADARIRG